MSLVACLLLTACSSVQVRYPDGTTEYQERAAFEQYVERVFRYQNRVVNDLIVAGSLLDDVSLDSDVALVRAEAELAAACRTLNEVVSATLEGRDISLFKRLSLTESVPRCETSARQLEALIPAF